METFLFMGSRGGAGRTTSSLLFAAGLTTLGLHPLHVQVMTANRQPALVGVQEVPFPMEWVATSQDFLAGEYVSWHLAQHPSCFPVVVDMPAERIQDAFATETDARILLPMREGAHEIETAARDLRDAQEEHRRRGRPRCGTEQVPPPAWLLPIGWPRGLRPEDYATILGRRFALLDIPGTFPVIRPGLRAFDMPNLTFSDDAGRFRLTPEQWDVAMNLAWAILMATDGSGSMSLAGRKRAGREVIVDNVKTG